MNRSAARSYPPVVVWKLILWMLPFTFLMYLSVDVTRDALGKTGGCILYFLLVSLYICWVTKRWYLFVPFFLASTMSLALTLAITGGM